MDVDHFIGEAQLVEDDQEIQVDQRTMEDSVGHTFQGEDLNIHPTIIVKEELQDDISLLNSRPPKQQRLEFDGVLLPSPAEVRQRWALEADPTQANSLDEVEEMNKKVESWRNVCKIFVQIIVAVKLIYLFY